MAKFYRSNFFRHYFDLIVQFFNFCNPQMCTRLFTEPVLDVVAPD